MKICLAPTWLLALPRFGGNIWVYMNWALGLQANGLDVVWLERLPRRVVQGESSGRAFEELTLPETLERIDTLQARFSAVGLRSQVTLVMTDDERARFLPLRDELQHRTLPFEQAVAESDLLLSLNYSLDSDIVRRFRRSALVDIDPGFLQNWIVERQINVAEYDRYFTIGETVGRRGALFPDCGLSWEYTPPAVFLPAWPASPSDAAAAYTTVSGWWIGWDKWRGEIVDNRKRTAFMRFADLPSRTSVPLELALDLGEDRTGEASYLETHGWKVRDAAEVSASPDQYRKYVQQSRGEFSCAKTSYVHLRTAWISDRTLCYLASGKPAVVEHTGPSRFLPDSEGLFRFDNLKDAARCLGRAEADYERQCRLARTLAEEFFDAARVTKRVLEKAVE